MCAVSCQCSCFVFECFGDLHDMLRVCCLFEREMHRCQEIFAGQNHYIFKQCCNRLQERFVQITVCVLRSNAIEKHGVHHHDV